MKNIIKSLTSAIFICSLTAIVINTADARSKIQTEKEKKAVEEAQANAKAAADAAAKAAAHAKATAEAAAIKAKADGEKAAADARAKAEADAKAAADAAAIKAKADAEKAAADARAKAEADAKFAAEKAAADARAKAEADAKAAAEAAAAKAKEDAEKAAAEAKAKAEADAKAAADAAAEQARAAAEKAAADARAKAEADAKAAADAAAEQARAAAAKTAEIEAKIAAEKAAAEAAEIAKQKAEADAKLKAENDAKMAELEATKIEKHKKFNNLKKPSTCKEAVDGMSDLPSSIFDFSNTTDFTTNGLSAVLDKLTKSNSTNAKGTYSTNAYFNFSKTGIVASDIGRILDECQKQKKTVLLNLSFNKNIDDSVLNVLANNLKIIFELNLNNTNLTDAFVDEFIKLTNEIGTHYLDSINLSDTKISEAAIQRLKTAMRDRVIVIYEKHPDINEIAQNTIESPSVTPSVAQVSGLPTSNTAAPALTPSVIPSVAPLSPLPTSNTAAPPALTPSVIPSVAQVSGLPTTISAQALSSQTNALLEAAKKLSLASGKAPVS